MILRLLGLQDFIFYGFTIKRNWRTFRFPTGSKTYIPKNLYTKTTYSPLTSEKFGGRPPLPPPQSYAHGNLKGY
ncbi:hypothetical protein HanIR_Chr01g0030161 [Helianthus annuus]|nr:hypothetical protein HanIR_Chr01g0030161 [Helianthus annuus]